MAVRIGRMSVRTVARICMCVSESIGVVDWRVSNIVCVSAVRLCMWSIALRFVIARSRSGGQQGLLQV